VEPDQELAAAVAGREHWQIAGRAALYAPPGSEAAVRVQPLAQPTRRERYVAVIVRGGRAEHNRPCYTVVEAVLL
jgi:hypothetical protein